MLFKFTLNLFGVTVIALALYGCPPKDGETGDNGDKLSLKTGSGTATLESNGNVKVTATVHNGDDPAKDVEVVFSVKCGDTAVVFDKVTTGTDGVATATKEVAGATDADALGACDVTASLDGKGGHVVRAKSGGGNTPTDEKIMGKVYELSWDATAMTTDPYCDGSVIYFVDNDGAPKLDITYEQIGKVEAGEALVLSVIVLPIKADAGDCTLNDKDKTVIKFNKDAFSTTVPTGCIEEPPSCWLEANERVEVFLDGDIGIYSGPWIKKNGDNYVHHKMHNIMGKVYALSWEENTGRTAPCDGDAHIFKVGDGGKPAVISDWGAEMTNQNIVVLPTSADATCTLNDKDKTVIKANPDAFTTDALVEGLCDSFSCWNLANGSLIDWTGGGQDEEGSWIRMTNIVYVHHKIP